MSDRLRERGQSENSGQVKLCIVRLTWRQTSENQNKGQPSDALSNLFRVGLAGLQNTTMIMGIRLRPDSALYAPTLTAFMWTLEINT